MNNSNQPWLRASIKITKPIVLIDMDGVICDFDKRAKEVFQKLINCFPYFSFQSHQLMELRLVF